MDDDLRPTRRPRRRAALLGPHAVALLLVVAGCVAVPGGATLPPPGGPGLTVVAAGDIACDPSSSSFHGGDGTSTACRQKATSEAALALHPDAVLLLGDTQYADGTLAAYQGSFDPTWGRLEDVTYPAPGNHEYHTAGAAGYYAYFGAAAGDPAKGYYSFDLGDWHLVAINSNCDEVGGCDAGSPQETWLRQDLAAHPAACTLAFWHHPRYSSGNHGDRSSMTDVWQALMDAGADVVLAGHDHDYERFAPQDAHGNLDAAHGIRQFVVGSGGKSHYAIDAPGPHSEAHNDDTFGVLVLTLRPGGYGWSFVPEAGGSYADSGTADCH